MSAPPEVRQVVRGWIQKAEHDLKNAEHTLTLDDASCPFDTVCFHAQQSVEKYFKALLTLKNVSFPKTHDLTELFALIPKTVPLQITMDQLAELSPYAVESRYPGEWEPLSREEADHAVDVAKQLRLVIRDHLKEVLA